MSQQQQYDRKFSRDDRRYNNDNYRGGYNNNNENGRQSRKRSASRSRSRSRSRSDSREKRRRDRTYNNDRGGRNGYNDRGGYNKDTSFGNYSKPQAEPSAVIMIKGLPSHTNEPTLHAVLGPYYAKDIRLITQRDGECKGFAFVEFVSLEYAQYFMSAFAGSAGDPDAPQLIIENRGVTIEYARDQTDKRTRDGGSSRQDERKLRTDWLCDACSCHNFARRDTCFRCNLPRSDKAVALPQGSEPFGDSVLSCDTPGPAVVVRGFGPYVTEDQIMELFRQFAVVKSAVIIRDNQTGVSKGFAFVEFHSTEHATYAVQCAKDLKMDSNALKVAFAREKVMQQMVSQMQSSGPGAMSGRPPMHFSGMANSLVASAMQAAQWSLNNGYGGGALPPNMTTSHPALPLPGSVPMMPIPPVQKPKVFWPPNFDTFGGSYIFQPKSGYFLEPVTEFFYCPKSKLYYNAKDGIYYTFDNTIEPPFRKFIPPQPLEPDTKSTDVTTSSAAVAMEPAKTKPITLSLGIKGKPKTVGVANKKVMKDLAKWEAIQKEDDEEEEVVTNSVFAKKATTTDVTKSASPATATTAPAPTNEAKNVSTATSPLSASSTSSAVTPAAVAPATTNGTNSTVCLLCRRQFPSPEMLARHEKESKLHAENLAKQQAQQQQQQQQEKPPAPQYRDRAEERRQLFGSVADHVERSSNEEVPPTKGAVVKESYAFSSSTTSSAAPAALATDVANPGNVMLRKMGWKDGQGLGKDGGGTEEALGVTLSANQSSSMHNTLKSTTGGSGEGGGSHYRDNLLAATRMRYEQVSKQPPPQ